MISASSALLKDLQPEWSPQGWDVCHLSSPDLQAAQQPPCWQQKSTRFQLIQKRGARGFWEAENEHLPEKQTHNKQPSNAWLLYLHHTRAKHRFSARSYTQIHLKTTAHKHSSHKFWELGFVRGVFCWKDTNPAILDVWKAAIAAKSELNQLLNTSTNYPDVGKTSHAHVSQKHWRLWDESQQWRGCHAWKDTVMTWGRHQTAQNNHPPRHIFS